jgi:hypothetical protein
MLAAVDARTRAESKTMDRWTRVGLVVLLTVSLSAPATAWTPGGGGGGRGGFAGWSRAPVAGYRNLGLPQNLAPITEPQCSKGTLAELNPSWRNLWRDGAEYGQLDGIICYVGAPPPKE